MALTKYPLPILCTEQATFLEGVGDTVAQRFQQMIVDREKEYEDGLFYGAIAGQQQANQSSEFAGINLDEYSIAREELQNMSLKQFLVAADRENFDRKHGNAPDGKRKPET